MNDIMKENHLKASVVDVLWERIHLTLKVKLDVFTEEYHNTRLTFYLVNGLYKAKAELQIKDYTDGVYSLQTNITNNGENRCLPIGTYSVYVCYENNILSIADTSTDIVEKMDDFSRNFLYGNRKKVFSVTFFVEEGGEDLPFRMYVLNSSNSGMNFPVNPKAFSPFKAFEKSLKNRYNKRSFYRRIYKLYSNKHDTNASKKTILFMTEQSNVIASNLKAVSERMITRGMQEEYNIIFSSRAASAEKQTFGSWVELIKKLASSDYIFVDDHAPILDWLKLKSYTKVTQLWHAGAGFKSSGYSRWGHIGCPSPQSCHRQYTYGISGSKHISPFFSEVWGINDELVLPTGMPRMDEYLDDNYRTSKTEEIYESYPLCKGKKVILFAPTYRGKNKAEAYYPYELIDFAKLYEICNDEYVVLFKMHPWVSMPVPIPDEYQDRFVDVNLYPNINDLFYVTDLLITDYSSNIFEYSLRKKPMLFFAYDKVQYSFSRGFHRAYEESAPGKVVYNFEDLLSAIQKEDFELEKVEEYVEHHFDYIDSGASDRVIDWIIYDNIPQNIKDEIKNRKDSIDLMNSLDFSDVILKEEEEEEDNSVSSEE